jgi:hypothetical protein
VQARSQLLLSDLLHNPLRLDTWEALANMHLHAIRCAASTLTARTLPSPHTHYAPNTPHHTKHGTLHAPPHAHTRTHTSPHACSTKSSMHICVHQVLWKNIFLQLAQTSCYTPVYHCYARGLSLSPVGQGRHSEHGMCMPSTIPRYPLTARLAPFMGP